MLRSEKLGLESILDLQEQGMDKAFYSTPEVAEFVGVFHTTVRRWIELGKVKGFRVGRNYKIPAEEVIRMLNHHHVPMPEMLRKRISKDRKKATGLPASGSHPGSILQELLIVEDIVEPAIICRGDAILGANRAFADLVGYSQADLIGLGTSEVIDRSSHKAFMDFAQQVQEHPDNKPFHLKAILKTDEMTKMKAIFTASPLRHIADALLLIIKQC